MLWNMIGLSLQTIKSISKNYEDIFVKALNINKKYLSQK